MMDKNYRNILSNGGLIIFPTETVYGIGCKFDNEEAINKIFKIKNRPASHPLILHIGSKSLIEKYAESVRNTCINPNCSIFAILNTFDFLINFSN